MDVASAQLQVDAEGPYVGLCYFDEEHARFFFGRESDAELIAANVLSSGVMILHGPSGVGKSSVLSAALPAALQKIVPGALVVAYRRWDAGFYHQLLEEAQQRSAQATAALPPLQEPVDSDAAADAQPYMGMQDGPQRDLDGAPSAAAPLVPAACCDQAAGLPCPAESLPASLEEVAQAWDRKADTPLVFVFDQFEQYFTGQDFGRSSEDEQFETDLARIVRLRDIGCHVLLSIREDALFELNRLRARIPNILARSLKLDFLDAEAAQEAIEGPLGVWRRERNESDGPTRAAADLITALIGQVSRRGDAAAARIDTPYLQLALQRLWQEERRQGSPELRLATLDALGGADGIAERHFCDTMKALPADERRLCAVVLERMVTPSGMKIALTAGDLAQMTGENDTQVTDVLERLADGRSFIIHKVASPQQNAAPLFEIFHDVLARPIRDWITAEHERAKQEQQLAAQRRAAEDERRRQQAELERQRLEAEQEQRRHQEELARKQQQLAREKQMKRRYRALAVLACIVAVAALAAFGSAISNHREAAATQGRMLAKQAERALETGDGRMALLLALAALPSQSGVLSYLTDWLHWPDRDFAQAVLHRALASPVGLGVPSTSGRLTLAAFAPDGRSIVTASEQGSIELWNGDAVARMLSGGNKQPLQPTVFRNHKRNRITITTVDFEASGKRFVTADRDGDVTVWDASHPAEPMKSWDVSERPVVAAISADGSRIATGSYGSETPTLWRPFGGPDFPGPEQEPVPWQAGHRYGITSIAFDAAGKRLVTTSFDGTAAVWRTADGRLLQAFSHGGVPLLSARFSRDGRRLATGALDGSVRIWALAPEAPRPACPAGTQPCFVERWAEKVPLLTLDHPDMVTSLAFDGSGRQLVTASLDGAARVWNTASGVLVRRLQGPAEVAGRYVSASISPDGGIVLATFMQRLAHFWPLQTAAGLPMVRNLPARPVAIATDVGVGRVAVASDTGVEISDAVTGAVLQTIPLDQPPLSVAMSPGGLFVAAAAGRTVGIWSIDGQAPAYRELPDLGSLVLSVAYDPLGERLITGYQDGSVRLWDANGRPLFEGKAIFDRVSGRTLAKRAPVFAAVFSADGSEILAGSFDGRLRVAEAATGRELPARRVLLRRPILGLQATDDDRRLAVDILDPPVPAADAAAPADDRFRISLQLLDATAHGKDSPREDTDRYRELLQSGNGLQVVTEAGERTIVTAPLDRRLRLGPLPPEDADGEVAYAREVRLSALPLPLRQLSAEEREERGLTTHAERAEHAAGPSAVAAATAAPR